MVHPRTSIDTSPNLKMFAVLEAVTITALHDTTSCPGASSRINYHSAHAKGVPVTSITMEMQDLITAGETFGLKGVALCKWVEKEMNSQREYAKELADREKCGSSIERPQRKDLSENRKQVHTELRPNKITMLPALLWGFPRVKIQWIASREALWN